jgi:hypothetical protein
MLNLSKRNLLYGIFSAIFIIIAVGIIVWIITQERKSDLRKQDVKTEMGKKSENTAGSISEEKDVVVENKEQAKKVLNDVDSTMDSVQSDE